MRSSGFLGQVASLRSSEGQLIFVALVLMLYTIALFISVSIHEILGHGLAAMALGGKFYAVYLSPGSGYISFMLPEAVSRSQAAFVYMAGIMVEILFGLALLFLVFPRLKNFYASLFTLVLSATMLVHPSIYLFIGYFYDRGDSHHAAAVLGIGGDIFVVTGMILTGIFVLLVSSKVLNYLGEFMEAESEHARTRILLLFWLPPLLLGAVSGIASSILPSSAEPMHTLASAGILLLFLCIAIFLVPQFIEPQTARRMSVSIKSVFAVMMAFIMVMSIWVGVFGLSESNAHGLLVSEPPIRAEPYYADYSIGNVEITVYSNETSRISIHLLNMMDQTNSSSLDRQIHATFADRPYWDYYMARSRNMLVTMFDLPRGMGDNISFNTSLGTIRAMGKEYDNGRICTTYFPIQANLTRQGSFFFQPGYGIKDDRTIIEFRDPWHSRGGYLDEVRLYWGDNVSLLGYAASNEVNTHIPHNRGNMNDNEIGWKNVSPDTAPDYYKFTLLLQPPSTNLTL